MSTTTSKESRMRKMLVIGVALAAVLGLVGSATAGASAPAKKPPVKLSGKVTNKGRSQ